MFRRFSRKGLFAGAGLVGVLAMAGAALAFFTSSGSGTGSATVGSSQALSVNVAAPSGGPLYPDGTSSETLGYTVTNNASFSQHIGSTTITVAHDGSGNVVTGVGNTAVPAMSTAKRAAVIASLLAVEAGKGRGRTGGRIRRAAARHQKDVSVIWDLGPHDFSILLYWLDELPVAIRAVGRDSIVPGIADVAFVTMTFASGIVANVELSWLAPSKLRRTVLVGSERMVIYDDGAPEPVRLFDSGVVYEDPATFGEYHLSYRTGDILSPKIDSYEPLGAEMADFISAIRRGDRMDFHRVLAANVVRMVEAADKSLIAGGHEIELRQESRLAVRRSHESRAVA